MSGIIFTIVVQVDSYTTSQIKIMQGRRTFQAKHEIFECGLLAHIVVCGTRVIILHDE